MVVPTSMPLMCKGSSMKGKFLCACSCQQRGLEPRKQFSGKFSLLVDPANDAVTFDLQRTLPSEFNGCWNVGAGLVYGYRAQSFSLQRLLSCIFFFHLFSMEKFNKVHTSSSRTDKFRGKTNFSNSRKRLAQSCTGDAFPDQLYAGKAGSKTSRPLLNFNRLNNL